MKEWHPKDEIMITAVFVIALGVVSLILFGVNPITSATVGYTLLTALLIIDSHITRSVMREEMNAVDEARRAADRPLVALYFEREDARIYLVIENIGPAPASNVTFEFDQPMSSSVVERIDQISMLKDGIPIMPPGYRTRYAFDVFRTYASSEHEQHYLETFGKDLPYTYTGTVIYDHALRPDSAYKEPLVADLSHMKDVLWFTRRDVHDVAEALRAGNRKQDRHMGDIARSLQELVQLASSGGSERELEGELDLPDSEILSILSSLHNPQPEPRLSRSDDGSAKEDTGLDPDLVE